MDTRQRDRERKNLHLECSKCRFGALGYDTKIDYPNAPLKHFRNFNLFALRKRERETYTK